MSKKIGIVVAVITVVAVLVVCLVPLKEVAYTVMVDYQDIETYYEYEPYQVLETYYETEPSEEITTSDIPDLQDTIEVFKAISRLRPKDYEVVKAVSRYETAYVTLRNTDEVAATFTVSFSFVVTTLKHHYYYGYPYIETHSSQAEKDIYLEPGEEGTVKASAKYYEATSGMTWSYTVWPGIEFPSRPTTSGGGLAEAKKDMLELLERWRALKAPSEDVEGQRVEKQRLVTKYRQVEKERTVTKQRPETRYRKVPLLDYVLHY